MKKQNHVNNLDEAMNWLNAYDYRVGDEISKRTERTAYRHDIERLELVEDRKYIIIASDHVLELATDSADDVIQFVNDMIDCFNEMQ